MLVSAKGRSIADNGGLTMASHTASFDSSVRAFSRPICRHSVRSSSILHETDSASMSLHLDVSSCPGDVLDHGTAFECARVGPNRSRMLALVAPRPPGY